MTGRGSSSQVVAETMESREGVEKMEEKNGSLARRGSSRRWREIFNEIGFLLSEQALAERPSFQEGMRGGVGVAKEDLSSTFTFESVRNPHFELSRI